MFLKIYLAKSGFWNTSIKNWGTVVCHQKRTKVAVVGGFHQLLEIQLPGKRKKWPPKGSLNGFKITKNALCLVNPHVQFWGLWRNVKKILLIRLSTKRFKLINKKCGFPLFYLR